MSDWQADEGEHWATNADRYTRMLAGFGDIVTAAAAYRDGERVLDVGCGNGDLSLLAARAVGPAGLVRGVDLSPAMVAVATTRAAAAGVDRVAFTIADAATFAPDPAAFDVMVSRFGVMFFPDPAAAFGHLRSLLAPGGRLVFVCWQDLFANEWMIVPGAAVAEVLPLPAGDPTAPGPFAFADRDRLTGILRTAGFGDIAAETAGASMWMGEDADDAVAFLQTTGLGRALFADADPSLVEEALGRARDALVPHTTPAGVVLDGSAWLVTATA